MSDFGAWMIADAIVNTGMYAVSAALLIGGHPWWALVAVVLTAMHDVTSAHKQAPKEKEMFDK